MKIPHLLIQHGADLSLADISGRSPANLASAHGRAHGRVKMLALIKKVNADLINQRDNEGRTQLLRAREASQNGAVEWLIEHGAAKAGEALEGTDLDMRKVQCIQMKRIISHKALHLSHIIFSLYCRVYSRRGKKKLDCCDWRLSIAKTPTARQIEQPKALD